MKKFVISILIATNCLCSATYAKDETYGFFNHFAQYIKANAAEQNENIEKSQNLTKNNLNVVAISQLPELPTGCEITSLAIVLNYYGYKADKCVLSDNYLAKGAVGVSDFNAVFIGNPRNSNSYGCYAPVIVNSAKKYLSERNSGLVTENITGTELEDLFLHIDKGAPVIVWGSINCVEPYYSKTWYVNGKKLSWISNEHCMVLTGYDTEKNTVSVADPLAGSIKEYNIDIFKKRYNTFGKQAVVIHESEY